MRNSAAYIKGWRKNLLAMVKKDNRFFFRAASKAQAAADFMLQKDKNGKPKYLKNKDALEKPVSLLDQRKPVKKLTYQEIEEIGKEYGKDILWKKPIVDYIKEVLKEKKRRDNIHKSVFNRDNKKSTPKRKVTAGKQLGLFGTIPKNPTVESALAYADKHLVGTSIYHADVQKKVVFTKRGIKKALNGTGRVTRTRIQLVFIAKDLLKKARLHSSEKDKKRAKSGNVFHTLRTKEIFDGQTFEVIIKLKESTNGTIYYDHTEIQLKKQLSVPHEVPNGKSKSLRRAKLPSENKVTKTGPKQKKGLSQPIVLDAGTSLNPVQPKRAAHNGDAAASVLEIPVISEEVNPIPQVLDIPTKKPLPARVNPKSKKVLSSGDLMNMHFESLDFDGAWAEFMQNPAKNMRLAIKGKPKNGKTSGSATFANYLTRFGNVLYNFVDQGFNKSTKDIWQLAGLADNPRAFASDIDNLEELEREIATGNYQFVFIDMINDYIDKSGIGPQEFKDRFIKKYNDVSFMLVFEVTKSGDFKGNQKWTHLVDAIVDVENFVMYNKGRYGMGHFVIWPEGLKRLDPKKYAELIGKENEQEVSGPTVLF